MEVEKQETTKKAYTTPALIEHGTVQDITGVVPSAQDLGSHFEPI